MVYEMSIDVSARNSPSKDGDEYLPFEPVELLDFGDLPDSCGTLLGSDGARQALVVNGPYLGPSVDDETHGQSVMGLTYARFRVGTVGGLGPTGLAPDGEGENKT